ncbi:CRE-SRC-1 protein [Pelomyxa schiedti]|nr:CRE-SRC-1 protein [Pelomyxa schiedti]
MGDEEASRHESDPDEDLEIHRIQCDHYDMNDYDDSKSHNNTSDCSTECSLEGGTPPRIICGEPDVAAVTLETMYSARLFFPQDPFQGAHSLKKTTVSIELVGTGSCTVTQFPSYYYYEPSSDDAMEYNISPWKEKPIDIYAKSPTPPYTNISSSLQQLEDPNIPSTCAITRSLFQHNRLPICLAKIQLEFVQETLESFLSKIQLPGLIPTLKAQDITTLTTLCAVTQAQFEEMRISIGNRIKITSALRQVSLPRVEPICLCLKASEIDVFFNRIQLSSLFPSFTAEDITSLTLLQDLSPNDFTNLKISIGHRIKIQEALASLVISDSVPSPPHSPPVLVMSSTRAPSPGTPSPLNFSSAQFMLSAATPTIPSPHQLPACSTPLHARRDISPPPVNPPTSFFSSASCSATQPGQEGVVLTGVVVDYSRPLGKGSFGTVWMGTWFGSIVAVKQVLATDDLVKEVEVNRRLNHPHCLRYYGVWYNNNIPHMVLEFMDGGDLHTFLRNHKKSGGTLPPLDLLLMARHAACGMMAMEEQHIVHRDLAARNLLISKNSDGFVVKVGDFGLSRPTVDGIYEASKSKFPVRWTAPECALDKKFTTMSDVWSYAVTLWEILTHGEIPYSTLSNDKVLVSIQTGTRLVMPPNCPLAVYLMMKQCWDMSPHHRPTFRSIFNTLTDVMDQISKAPTQNPTSPPLQHRLSTSESPPVSNTNAFNVQSSPMQIPSRQPLMSSSPALSASTSTALSISASTPTSALSTSSTSTSTATTVTTSTTTSSASPSHASDQQGLSQRPLSTSSARLTRPISVSGAKDTRCYAQPVLHVPYVQTSTVCTSTSLSSSSSTSSASSSNPSGEMGNKERDLFKWAQASRFDLLEKLIRLELLNLNLEATTELGNTFLHYLAALRYIDEKVLNVLELYCGHIFQLSNNKKETPLHIACLSKNKIMIQFLVKQHCNPEAKTTQSLTCYDYALSDEGIMQNLEYDTMSTTQHCSVDPSRAQDLGLELPPPFNC